MQRCLKRFVQKIDKKYAKTVKYCYLSSLDFWTIPQAISGGTTAPISGSCAVGVTASPSVDFT